MMKCTQLVTFLATYCLALAAARPQVVQQSNRPSVDRTNGEPAALFTPATKPAILYIRPLFDRDGKLIPAEEDQIQVEEVEDRPQQEVVVEQEPSSPVETELSEDARRAEALKNFQEQQRQEQQRRLEQARAAASRTQQPQRQPSPSNGSLRSQPDPVDFEESLAPSQRGFNTLEQSLPTFGNPETILKATEELRELDRNQEQFIKTEGANAGVLPLAFETPGALNLFPPLRPAQRLPKLAFE